MRRKLSKYTLTILLSFIFTFIVLLAILFVTLFLWRKSTPDDPYHLKGNICLHFEQNRGSNEHFLIFSYYCDASPDWETIMNPSIELSSINKDCEGSDCESMKNAIERILDEQGILDQVDTMECPLIEVKGDMIEIKQNKFCDFFAHDYPEPEFLQYTIDYEGRFIPMD